MKKIIAAIFLLLLATSCFAQEYAVEKVIDGDVLQLTTGEYVRLIGLDIPFGVRQEAREFTKKYFEGKNIRLEFDAQKKDAGGILLAYAYVDLGMVAIDAADGFYYVKNEDGTTSLFLNASIIWSGYARASVFPEIKHTELFKSLEQDAKKKQFGQWSRPVIEDKASAIDIALSSWDQESGVELLATAAHKDGNEWIVCGEAFVEETPQVKGETMLGKVFLWTRLDERGYFVNSGRSKDKGFCGDKRFIWRNKRK